MLVRSMQLGNWQRALDVYKDIHFTGLRPTLSTYNALMTALCTLYSQSLWLWIISIVELCSRKMRGQSNVVCMYELFPSFSELAGNHWIGRLSRSHRCLLIKVELEVKYVVPFFLFSFLVLDLFANDDLSC